MPNIIFIHTITLFLLPLQQLFTSTGALTLILLYDNILHYIQQIYVSTFFAGFSTCTIPVIKDL